MEESVQTNDSLAGKYLTFRLGREEYGLGILTVREINGMMEITKVPMTPEFVKGVMNLRGRVIPVIDLRRKLGLDHEDDTEETCVIVIESKSSMMGIVVDAVSEVLDIAQEEIEPCPQFGESVQTDYIVGMGKVEGKVVTLLGLDAVLDAGTTTFLQ
jgi:purine-binding chemotaxis protein CheW